METVTQGIIQLTMNAVKAEGTEVDNSYTIILTFRCGTQSRNEEKN